MTLVHAEAERNTKSVVVVRGKNFVIPGILVSIASTGMRYKGRPDLALIVSENSEGVPAAGVFTKNLFTAAPVVVSKDHLGKRSSSIRAVLINAGIANACTGEEGIKRARLSAELLAKTLGTSSESILIASTGVIGPQIDVDLMAMSMKDLIKGLSPERWHEAAQAIMTTDTVPKLAYTEREIRGTKIKIGGIAKGSGMIAPNMATMLGVLCTDAFIEPSLLSKLLQQAVSRSFNAITVDGDTSTNDTVFILATGKSGITISEDDPTSCQMFLEALEAVSIDLSQQIVLDGEGATKFIEIQVVGATTKDDAKKVARTVAESPLVKTALYGEDANWGRIIAAVGRSGVDINPQAVSLFFNEVCVFLNGVPVNDEKTEELASSEFKKKHINIRISLGSGNATFRMWTCDLSHDYITINAKYRT
ncbi:MAG: bifunctional glutamate N-acetyltransferase/amino-acid acetyltransferase ArgJ [Thermodesulforhabdaceae bacterium]